MSNVNNHNYFFLQMLQNASPNCSDFHVHFCTKACTGISYDESKILAFLLSKVEKLFDNFLSLMFYYYFMQPLLLSYNIKCTRNFSVSITTILRFRSKISHKKSNVMLTQYISLHS